VFKVITSTFLHNSAVILLRFLLWFAVVLIQNKLFFITGRGQLLEFIHFLKCDVSFSGMGSRVQETPEHCDSNGSLGLCIIQGLIWYRHLM